MLKTLWLLLLVASLLLFTLSVVLTFVFKIPDLVDEMSGRKAKRQIKKLRELSTATGSLEGMSTEDIYYTLPSGTLLSEEIAVVKKEEVADKSSEDRDLEEETKSEESLNVKQQEESETSFVDESAATGILTAVEEFCIHKKNIIIIEEQTSL